MLSALSLFVPFLFGLGWLVVPALMPRRSSTFLEECPLALTAGMVLNCGLVLCFQSLRLSLLVGGILSLLGLGHFGASLLVRRPMGRYFQASPMIWGAILGILSLYTLTILSRPLEEWDARSVWFFHAKMVYYEGALSPSTGWDHPSVHFTHFDYPKLLPVLAAEVGCVMGYWNEYLPKVALCLMLIPPVFWVVSFLRCSWSFAFLICVFPFAGGEWLWNGYMDGYLAFYFAAAMLLVGRYSLTSRPIDFISGIGCLLLVANLKNEGLSAVVAGGIACAIAGMVVVKADARRLRDVVRIGWRQWVPAAIGIMPTLLWYLYYKRAWALTNNLQLGTAQSFTRFWRRLADGKAVDAIVGRTYEEVWLPLWILLGFVAVLCGAGRRLPARAILPVVAGGLHGLGIMTAYLASPDEITWLLDTSVQRTMLAVSGCFCVGVFWAMDHVERMPGDA